MGRRCPYDAHNFSYATKRAWEEAPRGEHNAVKRAQRLGAVRICAVICPDVWQFQPGDMPASLWRFLDGSEYIIGDDGHWIQSPRPPGRKRARRGG